MELLKTFIFILVQQKCLVFCLLPNSTVGTTFTVATTSTVTILMTTTIKPEPKHHNRIINESSWCVFECEFSKVPSKIILKKDNNSFIVVTNNNGKLNPDPARVRVSGASKKWMINLTKISFTDEGNYACYVYIDGKEVIDQTYSIKVVGPPSISLQPLREIYPMHFSIKSIFINCSAIGNPSPTVVWNVNNIQVSPSVAQLKILKFQEIRNQTYTCTASNKYGTYRAPVFVQVLDSKPSQPIDFKVIKREERNITLSWKNSLPGISPLSFYILTRNGKNETLPLNPTEFKDTSLKPYQTYMYILYICNQDNLCSSPKKLSASTLEQARPSKPTEVNITDVNTDNITIYFQHGEHHSSQNISYSLICYNENSVGIACGRDRSKCHQVKLAVNQYTIYNLRPYNNYLITVETCIDRMNATCSLCATANITTKMDVPSSARSVLVRNSDSEKVELVVSWERPLELNAPYVKYQIMIKKDSENSSVIDTNLRTNVTNFSRYRHSINEFSYTIKDLEGSTTYFIDLITFNAVGHISSLTRNITTDESVPFAPTNLELNEALSSSLKLSWLAPASKPTPVSYSVKYFRKDSLFPTSKILSVVRPGLTITSLNENTAYVVHIRARIFRQRDNKILIGPTLKKTFSTVLYVPPSNEANQVTLIVVTVIMVILIVLVIIAASIYCRLHGLCAPKYKSTFYRDSSKEPGVFALSLRQSLKTLEATRGPMNLTEFKKHVKELHANSDYLFSEEYGSLGPNRPDRTYNSAHSEVNLKKNRYFDIAAYDQTRVRLLSLDGVPGSNYINANYIDGYHKPAAYVATQAPLHHTIADFWRMVWETNSRVIIMLTNLIERGKRKSDQYWPTDGVISYKGFDVTLECTEYYANYIVRKLAVTNHLILLNSDADEISGETRHVWQYHYTEWPDFGVPRETSSILSFILRTREHESDIDAPSILHCSAGVGRTGTFIVLDAQMRRYNDQLDIEIYNFLKKIRHQRSYLVQQEAQYIFIHDAIVDYACAGNTQIKLIDLEMKFNQEYWNSVLNEAANNKLDREWSLHESFVIPSFHTSSGCRQCNREKNRDQTILPVDSSRFHLRMKATTEGSDYINASYIHSFHFKNAYIVTQAPIKQTLEDFWRMIYESNAAILVNLMTFEETAEEDHHHCIPGKIEDTLTFGSLRVKLLKERQENNYIQKDLVLTFYNGSDTISRCIYYYHYNNWQSDFFPRTAFLFELIMDVLQKLKCISDKTNSIDKILPIIIYCRFGIGRSGLLCALLNLLEQIKSNLQIVDVYATVRMLLYHRPSIIENKEQYSFLYKALVALKHYVGREEVQDDF